MLPKFLIAIAVLIGLFFVVNFFIHGKDELLKKIPLKNIFSKSQVSCPDSLVLQTPVDMNRVTSVLYPGQIRGREFKAHGGFRFDGSQPDEIIVYAPYDAYVIAGARYPVNGEIQYTFDFELPCGIQYRFGHLLTLTPKFHQIAEGFPLPNSVDSSTTQVNPPIEVKQGEIIATAVGLSRGGPEIFGGVNTFLDWGVYDYRQQNEATKDPNWATKYLDEDPNWSEYYDSDTYKYAICWFDWISPEDRKKVLVLPPADDEHGKESEFCK